ncbi:hypothetical protein EMIT0P253_10238 [Pseudomonas sp. IT-P253]|jgi:hypothetical protein
MVERVEEQFDINPEHLIGDITYGTASMLEEKNIEQHVLVWDKTERNNGSLSSNNFHWNEEAEEYRCPIGNALCSTWRAFKKLRSHVTKANTLILRSRQCALAIRLQRGVVLRH